MIAFYCRVSSRHQKPDSEQAEIIQWLQGHAMSPSGVQWFEDIETGSTLNRPILEAMRRAICAGIVETNIMWKLDRLSRRQHEGVHLLADWCKREGWNDTAGL